MHSHTPTISVIEPRGLPVRALAYHRRAVGEPCETRVTHQVHDTVGRLCEQRDPRLFSLMRSGTAAPPNLRTFQSLSGQHLCSDSVDAGWQLNLPGAGGQMLESWDQRGWHRRTEHDPLLRPVALFEHFAEEPERCAERITWGSSSPDDALHNRCGQAVRHDDPAGSRLLPEYGLTGAVLAEDRHFLDSLEQPDWPVTEAERDPLLERGEGAGSAWHFAATGEALRQTDAKGHIRHFTHDRAGQLRDIRLQRAGLSSVETLVSAIEYTASGQVLQELAGNGMRTLSSYDPANAQLLSLANQAPDGMFLQNLSYRYDPVGNITAITDAALPIQYFANQRIEPVRYFTYDTLYQLIEATGWESAKPSLGPELPEWQAFGPPDSSRWCNYSETYHYDEAANLLQRVHQGAVDDTLTMQVAAHSNRSIKVRPGANLDESFDARGNLLELQSGQRLQWNGRNELAEVTQVARSEGTDDLERYVYDGEGTRLRKWRTAVAKSVTHAAEVRYLPGIELHTNSATGERLQVVSVQAGRCSVRLLHWDSPPASGVKNDQLRYCFDDHLGSSAFEVDGQAKPISQEMYYPFGGTAWLAGRHEVETSYKTIRYSGKERDTTGLYYYGARYYAPWLQRWLNPDPAGEVDGLNFFCAVRNSPLNFIDSEGRYSIWAVLNDYLIEAYGISGVVAERGMNEIRAKQPEISVELENAFHRSVMMLDNSLQALNSPSLSLSLIKKYAGDVASERVKKLREDIESMKDVIARYGPDSEKLVLINGDWENNAKIFRWDRRKKIYFNSQVLLENTTEANAQLLLHEISHFALDTKDYWYVMEYSRKGTAGEWIDSHGLTLNDNLAEAAFVDESSRILRGDIRGDDIEKDLLHDFKTGDKNIVVGKFNNNPGIRSEKSLRNADTFTAIIRALSRSHQKQVILQEKSC